MAALKIVVLITHWFYIGEVYSLESSLIIFCVLFLEVSWMRESREQAAIPHFEFSIWCARPAFWLQRLFPTEIQCSIAGRNRTVKPTCLGEGGNSRKRMCKYCITNVLHKAPLPEKMLCRSYFFILPPFTPSFALKIILVGLMNNIEDQYALDSIVVLMAGHSTLKQARGNTLCTADQQIQIAVKRTKPNRDEKGNSSKNATQPSEINTELASIPSFYRRWDQQDSNTANLCTLGNRSAHNPTGWCLSRFLAVLTVWWIYVLNIYMYKTKKLVLASKQDFKAVFFFYVTFS